MIRKFMAELVLQLEDVSVSRNRNKILKGVDLSIEPSTTWAILGPNGSGKSFLLRVISGDLVPSSGSVSLLNETIGRTDMRELRKSIGYVSSRMEFQFSSEISVHDVIYSGFSGCYGVPSFRGKEKVEVSEQQESTINRLVKEYSIPTVTRKFATLSDGEKKRVLIARALVNSPKLLIFDEPCQGLDISGRNKLLEILSEISQRIPSVFVVHHLEELPNTVTHVALLSNGAIVDKGMKSEILVADKLSELFSCPIKVLEHSDSLIMVKA